MLFEQITGYLLVRTWKILKVGTSDFTLKTFHSWLGKEGPWHSQGNKIEEKTEQT